MKTLTKEKIIEVLKRNTRMVYDLRYTGKIIEIERYEAIASELAGQESEDWLQERIETCTNQPVRQLYHLNCDKCGATYWSQEGFPKPQLCINCDQPAKAEAKTGKCDCQVWEGIDRNGFCRICGGEPRSILSYTESEPVKDEAKKKPDYHNDIYGPGDDNYGRDKPFWKAEAKTAEIPNDIVTKMQHEFEPNPDTSFKQGMYSGYAFGLQDGFKYASQQPLSDEEIEK